jgi:hypothetical protein
LVGNDGRQLLHQFEDGHYEEGDRGEEKTGGGRKREPKREGESAGQHVERKESVDKPTGVRGGERRRKQLSLLLQRSRCLRRLRGCSDV